MMQVYKIYCTVPNKSAMRNKVQTLLTAKKTKHAKCAATKQVSTKVHSVLSFINTVENEYEITSKIRLC